MKKMFLILVGVAVCTLVFSAPSFAQKSANIYLFSVKTIDGDPASLKEFEGKVLLIVNTASRCGFTSQYDSLEKLYQQFRDRGFVVLAFPANNFQNQEPGTDKEIKNFCFLTYKTSFPLFSKVSVQGKDICPLYDFLTTKTRFVGPITWNFNKFLVNRKGDVVARFESSVDPLAKEVVAAIEAEVANP